MKFSFSKLLIIVLLLGAYSLYADYFIEISHMGDGEPDSEKTYIKGSKVKSQGQLTTFVIDTKKETVLFESHRNRIYWEGSFTDFEAGVKKAKKDMMDKMFEGMPPEQRKMMEERMKKAMQSDTLKQKITIKATGKTKTFVKYECKEYEVLDDGKKIAVFYHTDKVKPYATLDMDKIDKLMNKMSFSPASHDFRSSDAYKKYNTSGLIMMVEEVAESFQPVANREEVVSLEDKELDYSFFGPSENYKPISIEELFMAEFSMDEGDEDEEMDE